MDATEKGKTLWEMTRDKLWSNKVEQEKPPELKGFNPAGAKRGDFAAIETADFAGIDFIVTEVDFWKRRLGREVLEFTDYILEDPQGEPKTLRIYPVKTTDPTAPKHCDVLVLHRHRNFAYDEGLHKSVLPEGTLEVRDDQGNLLATYTRLGGIKKVYSAEVTVIDGQGDPRVEHFDYWDFGRDLQDGSVEYYFVEMSQNEGNRGEFQTYRGVEISEKDVKFTRRKVE